MAVLSDKPFEPAALLERFLVGRPHTGAVVTFTGLCRAGREEQPVTALYLDAYPPFTRKQMDRMEQEALERFAAQEALIHHRYGEVHPGEPIIFVAVAAEHRRAAFDAADFLMDRLKTEAPLWKREQRGERVAWIEATADDYNQARRWSAPA